MTTVVMASPPRSDALARTACLPTRSDRATRARRRRRTATHPLGAPPRHARTPRTRFRPPDTRATWPACRARRTGTATTARTADSRACPSCRRSRSPGRRTSMPSSAPPAVEHRVSPTVEPHTRLLRLRHDRIPETLDQAQLRPATIHHARETAHERRVAPVVLVLADHEAGQIAEIRELRRVERQRGHVRRDELPLRIRAQHPP